MLYHQNIGKYHGLEDFTPDSVSGVTKEDS